MSLQNLAGEPNGVKTLRNGSGLVECATKLHSKNGLKSKHLYNTPINVSPQTTLNISDVVQSKNLEGVHKVHDWCNKGNGMCYPVWDGAYKTTLAVNRKSSPCDSSGFPLSLYKWFFTICPTPYTHKLSVECVVK